MKRPSQSVGSFHFPYQRILVTGANGAGKSWLARRLADILDISWVNNDALSLGTGWVYLNRDIVAQAQSREIAKDCWVLDGGPSLVRSDILLRCDVVIWLDPPAWRRLWRILRRTATYMGRTRPEHPSGNVEWPGRRQLRFIYKAWANDAKVRASIATGLEGEDICVIRFTSPDEVQRFLTDLNAIQAAC